MGPCGLWALDLDDYTTKLQQLFADAAMRERLASKSRAHAETSFSTEAGIQKLVTIYQRVLGIESSESPSLSIDYVLSPLGFLCAGEVGAPGSLTTHAITGELSEAVEIELLRVLVPHIKSVLVFGAPSALHGFFAAHAGPHEMRVVVVESDAKARNVLERTVWLNNWENRVTIAATHAGHSSSDVVSIDVSDSTPASELDAFFETDKPVLIFNRSAQSKTSGSESWLMLQKKLANSGYRFWNSSAAGDWQELTPSPSSAATRLFALHAEKHAPWIPALAAQARRYRIGTRWSKIKNHLRQGLREVLR
jgi:hypothetical protein